MSVKAVPDALHQRSSHQQCIHDEKWDEQIFRNREILFPSLMIDRFRSSPGLNSLRPVMQFLARPLGSENMQQQEPQQTPMTRPRRAPTGGRNDLPPNPQSEPIGVPPSATARRRAITRPRIPGSVESCIILLVTFVRVRTATPIVGLNT